MRAKNPAGDVEFSDAPGPVRSVMKAMVSGVEPAAAGWVAIPVAMSGNSATITKKAPIAHGRGRPFAASRRPGRRSARLPAVVSGGLDASNLIIPLIPDDARTRLRE